MWVGCRDRAQDYARPPDIGAPPTRWLTCLRRPAKCKNAILFCCVALAAERIIITLSESPLGCLDGACRATRAGRCSRRRRGRLLSRPDSVFLNSATARASPVIAEEQTP